MYQAERHQLIVDAARRDGRVAVAELADDLGVTTETVRRDLNALEERGTLRRVHGGAIPVERLEPTLATRTGRSTIEKRRIAARALDELPTDGAILLDGGSTTQTIAELLPTDCRLTVVTNSISAAGALMEHPNITLLLLGGRVRGVTGTVVGSWVTDQLRGLRVDLALIGTNGLSIAHGLSTPDENEAAIKRALIAAAARTVVVTDASKLGANHLHSFAPLSAVDLLITDSTLHDGDAAAISEAGPTVVRA